MYTGKLVFAQVMEYLPLHTFRRCVARYRGDHKVRSFSCLDQFLCMAFAQLDLPRESARHRSLPARAASKLYHLGIRGRSRAAPWPMPTDARLAHLLPNLRKRLIATARQLYVNEPLGRRSERDRLRARFHHDRSVSGAVPWAQFRVDQSRSQTAHPARSARSDSHLHPHLRRQAPRRQRPRSAAARAGRLLRHGSRLPRFRAPVSCSIEARSFFVTRAKVELRIRAATRIRSNAATGLICDQTGGAAPGSTRIKAIPEPLRRIRFGSRDRQDAGLPDQQLRSAGTHHRELYEPLAGRACSSDGSNNICASRRSSAPPRMRSRLRSGSRSRSTYSWLSSRSGSPCPPPSMRTYRSSASRCSSDHRSINYLRRPPPISTAPNHATR